MALEKDLNVPPYFDDYDENKNFHKILFRPSTAVQARELTQLQDISQTQIERFANKVYKDGSIVDGCAITYYTYVPYISLEDNFNTNTNFLVSQLDNTYLITNSTDSNNAVRAVVKIAKDGIKSSAPYTNRIYLDYIHTGKDGNNNDVDEFLPGDTLYIYNSNQNRNGTLDSNNVVDTITTLQTNNTFDSKGHSYCIGISDGIIYQKGFFIKTSAQIINVKDFDILPYNLDVGFQTNEIIIDENIDASLNDNALGYSNENAPGAHRLKLIPKLIVKEFNDTNNNTNFFSIVRFERSVPVQQKDTEQYSDLEKHFAIETYEQSGDYVINQFNIDTLPSSNSQTFYYDVSPGLAYIRGYRTEKIGLTKIESPRATTTDVAQNQIITANYGNYIYCNEVLGAFDTETLEEISFYDQPQQAISKYEGVSTTPKGNLVGKANIRAVIYEQGTKGKSEAQYLIYLFNIRLNSGKSFTSDVKSIYSNGTFGGAKADLILERGVAVLKESNKSSLLFNSGFRAVKRLTNNTGIGDSLYNYNQIKSSTISNTGYITVSLDTAAVGASSERLTYTTGSSLTGTSLESFNIYLSSNAYSSNLTGSVAIVSSNVTITGSGTSFDTTLSANSIIRITANSTQTYIRKVVSVTNSTSIDVDVALPQSNSSTVIQKYYVTGTPLPLNDVVINSNTSFTANLGVYLDSGTQNVYCSYYVNRNQATAIPKIINKSRYVKIDCSNNVANSVGPWDLGLTDVFQIRNVYIGNTSSDYFTTNPEHSEWFVLDSGQRDEYYDHGKLVVLPTYASQITTSTKLLIEVDFFTANTSASVGFFSVESYPIDDANTANTNAIQTIDLPVYNGQELKNYIDFRPQKASTANTNATSISGATINPSVSSNSFSVPGTGQHLIIPDNNFEADFEYYLPRIDIISLDSVGNFTLTKGIPNVAPLPPFVDSDRMPISESYIPPYPSATVREVETRKNVPYIKTNLKQNRRYTMRDIGVLDDRLKRVEYYTVLNSLEQQAKDLTIPDANGLNRFKNGIFADPYNDHTKGNVTDFEYKVAIDSQKSVARPYFNIHDTDSQWISSNSTNIKQTGPVITLNYSNVAYISQRFATQYRNASESVWRWNGLIDLYPSIDFYRDEDYLPNNNLNLDLAQPWIDFANSPFGMQYGDWRTVSTQVQSTSNSVANSSGNLVTTTTTTTTTQQRTANGIQVNTTKDELNFGAYVKDVTIQPYMRARQVAFVAYNMKPNTTLHAFFDDTNVDLYCAPGKLADNIVALQVGLEDRVVTKNGNWGDPLVSDANGFICGVFNIPAGTFRTGDRFFQLINVDNLIQGSIAATTKAKARYTADSVSVTKQTTTLNVREPIVSSVNRIESRRSTNIDVSTQFIPDNPPTDCGLRSDQAIYDWIAYRECFPETAIDPISQSFNIDNLLPTVPGIFITRIGIYFKSKDQNLGCSLFVCEMVNNMPDMSRILSKAYLSSFNISVSDDASVETVFSLEYPAFLMKNNDYAFVIQPDGNSPEYNVWTAETGNFDVLTNEQVFSNPSVGLLFTSSNQKTWTPLQLEDIKFNIYRANFTANTGQAIFKNEDDEFLNINGFTKSNNSIDVNIGDIVYSVNSSANTANIANLVSHTLISNSTNMYPVGRINYFNYATGRVWLDSSSYGGFSNTTNPVIAVYRTSDYTNTSLISANTLIAYTTITSVDNLKYHAVVPKYGITTPAGTTVDIDFKGTRQSDYSFDTTYHSLPYQTEYEFDDFERGLISKSNEVSNMSGNKSTLFSLNLNSRSSYTSPVIDLSKKSSLFIENLINNDVTNEHTKYGNTLSKYISKTLVLADGQEAEDLKVYLTAYRPPDTDIKIYAKFWNNYDPETFDSKMWTILQYDNGGDLVYSSPTNKNNYIEYQFSVPTTNAVNYAAYSNNGSIAYNTLASGVTIQSDNTVVTAFKHSFNANTNVNNTADTIAITNANTYFRVNDYVTYSTASGNTVLSGLANNTSYYVSFANSTVIALSSIREGANVDITASTTSETGHYFTGTRFLEQFNVGSRIRVVSNNYIAVRTITNISNNTYLTVDKGLEQSNTASIYYVYNEGGGDGIVEYYNTAGSRLVGFKQVAIKIDLLSSNPVHVPLLDDVRMICLQV